MSKQYYFFKEGIRERLENNTSLAFWDLESWIIQNDWVAILFIIFLGIIFELVLVKICAFFQKKPVRPEKGMVLHLHTVFLYFRVDTFSERRITSLLTAKENEGNFEDGILSSDEIIWAHTSESEYQVSHFSESHVPSSTENSSSLSLFHSEVKEIFLSRREHPENEIQFSSKKLFSIMKTNKNKNSGFSSDLKFLVTKFTVENEDLDVAPCPPAHLFLSRDQVRRLEENVRNQIPSKPKAKLVSGTTDLCLRSPMSLIQNQHSVAMVISAQAQDSFLGQNAIQNQGFYEAKFLSQAPKFVHDQESINSQPDITASYFAQPQDLMRKPFISSIQDSFQAQDLDRSQHFVKMTQDSVKDLESDEQLGEAQYPVWCEDSNKIKYSVKGKNTIYKNSKFMVLTVSPNLVAEDVLQLESLKPQDQQQIASSELTQDSVYNSVPLSPTIKGQKNRRKTSDSKSKPNLNILSLKAKKTLTSRVFQITVCYPSKDRNELGCKNNARKKELRERKGVSDIALNLISVSKHTLSYIKKYSRKKLVKVMPGLIKCEHFLQKQNKSPDTEKINYTFDLHIPKHETPLEEAISEPMQKLVSSPKMESNRTMKIQEDLQNTENSHLQISNGEELPTSTPKMQKCFPFEKENIQKQKDFLEIVLESSNVHLLISLGNKKHKSSEELESTKLQVSTESVNLKKKSFVLNITEYSDLNESDELESNTRSIIKNMHQDKRVSDATYAIISEPPDMEMDSKFKAKTDTSGIIRLSHSASNQEKLLDEKETCDAKYIEKSSIFKKPQQRDREKENELTEGFKFSIHLNQKPKHLKFEMEQISSGSRKTPNEKQEIQTNTLSTQTILGPSPCTLTDPIQVEKVKQSTDRPTDRESATDPKNPLTRTETLPVGQLLIETEHDVSFGGQPRKKLDGHIVEEKEDLKRDLPEVTLGTFNIHIPTVSYCKRQKIKKKSRRKSMPSVKYVINKVKKPAISLKPSVHICGTPTYTKRLRGNFEIIITQILQDKIVSDVLLSIIYPCISILPNTKMHCRLNAENQSHIKQMQEESQVAREEKYLDSTDEGNESQNTLEAKLQDEEALPKAVPQDSWNCRLDAHPVMENKTEKEMHQPIPLKGSIMESVDSPIMDPSHVENVKKSLSSQTDFKGTADSEMLSPISGKSLTGDPLNQTRESGVPSDGNDTREMDTRENNCFAEKRAELLKDSPATSLETFNCDMPSLSCSKRKKNRVTFAQMTTIMGPTCINVKAIKPSTSLIFSMTNHGRALESDFQTKVEKINQAEGLAPECLNTLYSSIHSRLQKEFCSAQLKQGEPAHKKYVDFFAKSRAFYDRDENLQAGEEEEQKATKEAAPQHSQHLWSDAYQMKEIHLDKSDPALNSLTQELPVNGQNVQHSAGFTQTSLEASFKMDPIEAEELQKANKTENDIKVPVGPKIPPPKALENSHSFTLNAYQKDHELVKSDEELNQPESTNIQVQPQTHFTQMTLGSTSCPILDQFQFEKLESCVRFSPLKSGEANVDEIVFSTRKGGISSDASHQKEQAGDSENKEAVTFDFNMPDLSTTERKRNFKQFSDMKSLVNLKSGIMKAKKPSISYMLNIKGNASPNHRKELRYNLTTKMKEVHQGKKVADKTYSFMTVTPDINMYGSVETEKDMLRRKRVSSKQVKQEIAPHDNIKETNSQDEEEEESEEEALLKVIPQHIQHFVFCSGQRKDVDFHKSESQGSRKILFVTEQDVPQQIQPTDSMQGEEMKKILQTQNGTICTSSKLSPLKSEESLVDEVLISTIKCGISTDGNCMEEQHGGSREEKAEFKKDLQATLEKSPHAGDAQKANLTDMQSRPSNAMNMNILHEKEEKAIPHCSQHFRFSAYQLKNPGPCKSEELKSSEGRRTWDLSQTVQKMKQDTYFRETVSEPVSRPMMNFLQVETVKQSPHMQEGIKCMVGFKTSFPKAGKSEIGSIPCDTPWNGNPGRKWDSSISEEKAWNQKDLIRTVLQPLDFSSLVSSESKSQSHTEFAGKKSTMSPKHVSLKAKQLPISQLHNITRYPTEGHRYKKQHHSKHKMKERQWHTGKGGELLSATEDAKSPPKSVIDKLSSHITARSTLSNRIFQQSLHGHITEEKAELPENLATTFSGPLDFFMPVFSDSESQIDAVQLSERGILLNPKCLAVKAKKSPISQILKSNRQFTTKDRKKLEYNLKTLCDRILEQYRNGHITEEKAELPESLSKTFLSPLDFFMPVLSESKSQINTVQLTEREIILNPKCLTMKEKKSPVSRILKINSQFTTKDRKKLEYNIKTKLKAMWQGKNVDDTLPNIIYFTQDASDIKRQSMVPTEIDMKLSGFNHIQPTQVESPVEGIARSSDCVNKGVVSSFLKEAKLHDRESEEEKQEHLTDTSQFYFKNFMANRHLIKEPHPGKSEGVLLGESFFPKSHIYKGNSKQNVKIEKTENEKAGLEVILPRMEKSGIFAELNETIGDAIPQKHNKKEIDHYVLKEKASYNLAGVVPDSVGRDLPASEEIKRQNGSLKIYDRSSPPLKAKQSAVSQSLTTAGHASLSINKEKKQNLKAQKREKTEADLKDQETKVNIEEFSSESVFFSKIHLLQIEKQKKEFNSAYWKTIANFKTVAPQKKQQEPCVLGANWSSPYAYTPIYPKIIRHKDKAKTADVESAMHTKQLKMKARKTSVSQLLRYGTRRNKKEWRGNIQQQKAFRLSKNAVNLVLEAIYDFGCLTFDVKTLTEIKMEKDKPKERICTLPHLKLEKPLNEMQILSGCIDTSSILRKLEQNIREEQKHQSIPQQYIQPLRIREISYSGFDIPRIRTDIGLESLIVKERDVDIDKHSVSVSLEREGSKKIDSPLSSEREDVFLRDLDASQQKTCQEQESLKHEGISMKHLESIACPIMEPLHLENTGKVDKEGDMCISRKNMSYPLGREGLKENDILQGSIAQKFLCMNLEVQHKMPTVQKEQMNPDHVPESIPDSVSCPNRDPLHLKQAANTRKDYVSVSESFSENQKGKQQSKLTDNPLKSNRQKMDFSKNLRMKQLNICDQSKENILKSVSSCILHHLHIENPKKEVSAKEIMSSEVLSSMVEKASNKVVIPVDQPPYSLLRRGQKWQYLSVSYENLPENISYSQNYPCLLQHLMPQTKEALSKVDNVSSKTKGLDLFSKDQLSSIYGYPLEWIMPLVTSRQMNKQNVMLPLESYSRKYLNLLFPKGKKSSDEAQVIGSLPNCSPPMLGVRRKIESHLKKSVFSHVLKTTDCGTPSNRTEMQCNITEKMINTNHRISEPNLVMAKMDGSICSLPQFKLINETTNGFISNNVKRTKQYISQEEKGRVKAVAMKGMMDSNIILKAKKSSLSHILNRKELPLLLNIIKQESKVQEGKGKSGMKLTNLCTSLPSLSHPNEHSRINVGKGKSGILRSCLPPLKLQASSNVRKISFAESINRDNLSNVLEWKHLPQKKKESIENTVDVKDIMGFICITLKGKNSPFTHLLHRREPQWTNKEREKMKQENKSDRGVVQNNASILSSPHLEWDRIKEVYMKGITKFCLPSLTLHELSDTMEKYEKPIDDILSSIKRAKRMPPKDKVGIALEEIMHSKRIALKEKQSSVLKELQLNINENEKKIQKDKDTLVEIWSKFASLSFSPYSKGGTVKGEETMLIKTRSSFSQPYLQVSSDIEKIASKKCITDSISDSVRKALEDIMQMKEEKVKMEKVILLKKNKSSVSQEIQLEIKKPEKKIQNIKGEPNALLTNTSTSIPFLSHLKWDTRIENVYYMTEVTRDPPLELSHQKSSIKAHREATDSISSVQKPKDYMPEKEDGVKTSAKKAIMHQKNGDLEGKKALPQDLPLNLKETGKANGEGTEPERADEEGKVPGQTDGAGHRKTDTEGEQQGDMAEEVKEYGNKDPGGPEQRKKNKNKNEQELVRFVHLPSQPSGTHHELDTRIERKEDIQGISTSAIPQLWKQKSFEFDAGKIAHRKSIGEDISYYVKTVGEYKSQKGADRGKTVDMNYKMPPKGLTSKAQQLPLAYAFGITGRCGSKTRDGETNLKEKLGNVQERKSELDTVLKVPSLPYRKLDKSIEGKKEKQESWEEAYRGKTVDMNYKMPPKGMTSKAEQLPLAHAFSITGCGGSKTRDGETNRRKKLGNVQKRKSELHAVLKIPSIPHRKLDRRKTVDMNYKISFLPPTQHIESLDAGKLKYTVSLLNDISSNPERTKCMTLIEGDKADVFKKSIMYPEDIVVEAKKSPIPDILKRMKLQMNIKEQGKKGPQVKVKTVVPLIKTCSFVTSSTYLKLDTTKEEKEELGILSYGSHLELQGSVPSGQMASTESTASCVKKGKHLPGKEDRVQTVAMKVCSMHPSGTVFKAKTSGTPHVFSFPEHSILSKRKELPQWDIKEKVAQKQERAEDPDVDLTKAYPFIPSQSHRRSLTSQLQRPISSGARKIRRTDSKEDIDSYNVTLKANQHMPHKEAKDRVKIEDREDRILLPKIGLRAETSPFAHLCNRQILPLNIKELRKEVQEGKSGLRKVPRKICASSPSFPSYLKCDTRKDEKEGVLGTSQFCFPPLKIQDSSDSGKKAYTESLYTCMLSNRKEPIQSITQEEEKDRLKMERKDKLLPKRMNLKAKKLLMSHILDTEDLKWKIKEQKKKIQEDKNQLAVSLTNINVSPLTLPYHKFDLTEGEECVIKITELSLSQLQSKELSDAERISCLETTGGAPSNDVKELTKQMLQKEEKNREKVSMDMNNIVDPNNIYPKANKSPILPTHNLSNLQVKIREQEEKVQKFKSGPGVILTKSPSRSSPLHLDTNAKIKEKSIPVFTGSSSFLANQESSDSGAGIYIKPVTSDSDIFISLQKEKHVPQDKEEDGVRVTKIIIFSKHQEKKEQECKDEPGMALTKPSPSLPSLPHLMLDKETQLDDVMLRLSRSLLQTLLHSGETLHTQPFGGDITNDVKNKKQHMPQKEERRVEKMVDRRGTDVTLKSKKSPRSSMLHRSELHMNIRGQEQKEHGSKPPCMVQRKIYVSKPSPPDLKLDKSTQVDGEKLRSKTSTLLPRMFPEFSGAEKTADRAVMRGNVRKGKPHMLQNEEKHEAKTVDLKLCLPCKEARISPISQIINAKEFVLNINKPEKKIQKGKGEACMVLTRSFLSIPSTPPLYLDSGNKIDEVMPGSIGSSCPQQNFQVSSDTQKMANRDSVEGDDKNMVKQAEHHVPPKEVREQSSSNFMVSIQQRNEPSRVKSEGDLNRLVLNSQNEDIYFTGFGTIRSGKSLEWLFTGQKSQPEKCKSETFTVCLSYPTMDAMKIRNLKKEPEIMGNLNHKISTKVSVSLPGETAKEMYVTFGSPVSSKEFSVSDRYAHHQDTSAGVSPDSEDSCNLGKPEKDVQSNDNISKMFSPKGLALQTKESLEKMNITEWSSSQNIEDQDIDMKKQVMPWSKSARKTSLTSIFSLEFPLQNGKQKTPSEVDVDEKTTVSPSLQILAGIHMDITEFDAARGKNEQALLVSEQEECVIESFQESLSTPWTFPLQSGDLEGKEDDKVEMHKNNTVSLKEEVRLDTSSTINLHVPSLKAEESQIKTQGITHIENNCPIKQKHKKLEAPSAKQNIQLQKLFQRNNLDSFYSYTALSPEFEGRKGRLTITDLKRELSSKYSTMKIPSHPIAKILGILGCDTPSSRKKLDEVNKSKNMVSWSKDESGIFIRSVSISMMSPPHTEKTTYLEREKRLCFSKFQEKLLNTNEIVKRDTLTIIKGGQNFTNTVPQHSQLSVVDGQQMQKLPNVKSKASLRCEINEKILNPQAKESVVSGHDVSRIMKKPDLHIIKQEENVPKRILTPTECLSVFGDPKLCKQRDHGKPVYDVTTQKLQQRKVFPGTVPMPPQVKSNEIKIAADGISAEHLLPIYKAIKNVSESQVKNTIQYKVSSDKLEKVQAYKPDDLKSRPFPEGPDRTATTIYPKLQQFTLKEKDKLANHLESKALEIRLNQIPEMAKKSLQKFNFYLKGAISEDNSWRFYPRHKKMSFMSQAGIDTVVLNLNHKYQKDSPPVSYMKTLIGNVSSGSMEIVTKSKSINKVESGTSSVVSASETPLFHILQKYSVKEKAKLLMHFSMKTLEIQMKAFPRTVRGSYAMTSAQDRTKPLSNCIHSAIKVPKRKNRILLLFEEKLLHQIDLDLQYKYLRFLLGLPVGSMFPKPSALPKHILKLKTIAVCKKVDDSGESYSFSIDTELLEQHISFKKQSPHENSSLRKFLEPTHMHAFDPNLHSPAQVDTRVLSQLKSHVTPEKDKQYHVCFQEINAYKSFDLRTQRNATSLVDSHTTQISEDFTDTQKNVKSPANLEESPALEVHDSEECMFLEANSYLSEESQNILSEVQKGIPLKNLCRMKETTTDLKPFYSEDSGSHHTKGYKKHTLIKRPPSYKSHNSGKYRSSSKMKSPDWLCHSSFNIAEIQATSSTISFSKEKLSGTTRNRTSYSLAPLTESNIKLHLAKNQGKFHMHPESEERKNAKFDLFRKNNSHSDYDYSCTHSKEKCTRKKKVCDYESERSDYFQSKHKSASKPHRQDINFHSEGRQNQPFFFACIPADSLEIIPQTIRWTISPKTLRKRNFRVPLVAKISSSWNIWSSSRKLLGSLSGSFPTVHQN
uniref:Coiled-coil domain containing 168 n=1 Tax=Microcebus murinus TaxID=30608 RepID=A0A8C5XFY2_MICMU